jgi:hypothetical protein
MAGPGLFGCLVGFCGLVWFCWFRLVRLVWFWLGGWFISLFGLFGLVFLVGFV